MKTIILLCLVTILSAMPAEKELPLVWEEFKVTELESLDIKWNTYFTSSYTVDKSTKPKVRQNRAFKGYCVNRLYLVDTSLDPKEIRAGKEINLFAEGAIDNKNTRFQIVKKACKLTLDSNTTDFRTTLFQLIKANRED